MPHPGSTATPEAVLWALTLLAAVVAGLLVGLLTFARSRNRPVSLLVASFALGATTLGMHALIGP